MALNDSRCYPLTEFDRPRLNAMLSPALGGTKPREVVRAEGRLVNTVYRITV